MATQCLHSNDFNPNDFTIISGPYSSTSGCYANCICPGTDCGPNSGIDPVTCNCTPLPSGGDPDPPGDPDLDCDLLDLGGSVTINGYAYYRDVQSTVTVLGQTLNSPCWGGHWCDRAEFTPTLVLSDNSVLIGSNNINLDNESGGGDRSDTFSFTLAGNPALFTSGTKFVLNCAEQNNNCHFGITWIVLTMEDATSGSEQILFNSCVVPGSLENLNLKCPSGVFCDTSPYSLSYSTSGICTVNGNTSYNIFENYSASFTWQAGIDSAKFEWISPYSASSFAGSTLHTANFLEYASISDSCIGEVCFKYKSKHIPLVCSGNVLWSLLGVAVSGKTFTDPNTGETITYGDTFDSCIEDGANFSYDCDASCMPLYYFNIDPTYPTFLS